MRVWGTCGNSQLMWPTRSLLPPAATSPSPIRGRPSLGSSLSRPPNCSWSSRSRQPVAQNLRPMTNVDSRVTHWCYDGIGPVAHGSGDGDATGSDLGLSCSRRRGLPCAPMLCDVGYPETSASSRGRRSGRGAVDLRTRPLPTSRHASVLTLRQSRHSPKR